jgi:uncharacterized protein (DUF1697 family)
MSHRFVAFLRGINVGRAKRVPMAELQAAVTSMGFTDVRTLLNSGNVVFSGTRQPTAGVARSIEEAVLTRTGVDSRVTVLTRERFTEILEANPLMAHVTDPSRAVVAFLREPSRAQAALAPLVERPWEPELLAVGTDAVYLWCPRGLSGGALAEAVDKALRDQVTMRNLATVAKVRALL